MSEILSVNLNEIKAHEQDAYSKLIRDENEASEFYGHQDESHMGALQQTDMHYHMNMQDVSSSTEFCKNQTTLPLELRVFLSSYPLSVT